MDQRVNRRHVLRSLAAGSGLFSGLVSQLMAEEAGGNPLAPKSGHFPGKAKRIILLYMSGGTSHVDTFDHKPKLMADHGKKYRKDYLSGPRWKFAPNPRNGAMVSDLFPHMRGIMDEVCLIKSMKTDFPNHTEAAMALHGGSIRFPRPSMGSWVTYGLGTENQNLPAFMVLAPEMPYSGSLVWDSVFLPATYQGVRVVPGAEPIPNIGKHDTDDVQNLKLGLINDLNRRHLTQHGQDHYLAGRMRTFETAFGMQTEAPEAFDISSESDATLKLYGLERGQTKGFGWQCLMARRLAERGVRFIELIDIGTLQLVNWDAHADMNTHLPLAKNVDQAIAGLIRDLKGRGLLERNARDLDHGIWPPPWRQHPRDGGPRTLGQLLLLVDRRRRLQARLQLW
jgi:hypothetical protein